MKLHHFIADRFVYIVFFLINTLLTVLVVQLDLSRQEASLHLGNIAYIAILSAAALLAFLIIDYVRQRAYFAELQRILDQPDKLEQALLLHSGQTHEQRLVQSIMEQTYRVYADILTQHKHTQERQLHQLQQWAHQMKTPISVIDLLTQQDNEAEPAAILESIREETNRLHGHVQMMLTAERLGHFEKDVQIRRIDAAKLVRDAINEYRSAWIKFGVYPKLDAPDGPYWVETDEKWASFLFKQLLSNALKYTAMSEKPAKRVTVGLSRTEEGVIAAVTDEGVGIPTQDVPRVFEPFFTGTNGRRMPEATGMGLYLAKEACDRLGHRIAISSRLGEGTSVTVLFPAAGTIFRDPLGR